MDYISLPLLMLTLPFLHLLVIFASCLDPFSLVVSLSCWFAFLLSKLLNK